MNPQISDTAQSMKPETLDALQELVGALSTNVNYQIEAADKIENDVTLSNTMRSIASSRKQICDEIGGFIALADEKPSQESEFSGMLRSIWTSFRAGLNAGDPKVVLIEAERAEDVLVNRFKKILPEIAGNPINDRLNDYFENVKQGHDQILALRNSYQDR